MQDRLFHGLTDPWPDFCFILSAKGEIVAANKAASSLLCQRGESLLPEKLTDCVSEGSDKIYRFLRTCSRSTSLIPISLTLEGVGQKAINCRCNGHLIKYAKKGSSPHIFLHCTKKKSDTTFVALNKMLEKLQRSNRQLQDHASLLKEEVGARKKSEELLFLQKTRYRTVADFTHDWEYWERPDGTMEYVSPACERISGYSSDAFIENPQLLHEIILPEDQDVCLEHRHDAFGEPNMRDIQFRIRRSDGEVRWIEHACIPVMDDDSNFLGIRASNRDITERKQVEQALRVSEEKYRLVIENSNDAILIVQDGLIKFVNPRALQVFSYDESEVIEKYFLEFLHPEDRPIAKERYQQISQGIEPDNAFQFRALDARGREKWLQSNATLITWNNRPAVLTFLTDISQIKEAEEHLKRRGSELEEMNMALKVLLRESGEAKENLERKVLANMKDLILPYIDELEAAIDTPHAASLVKVVRSNLNEITSSFSQKLLNEYLGLTPREIQIADLIRQGKMNKEIARFLNISASGVEFHRRNLRKKFNIQGEKINLQSFLQSLVG